MKVKLPDCVLTVASRRTKVLLVPRVLMNDDFGYYNGVYNEIGINADMCEERMRQTFLHEVIHILATLAGADSLEEDVVSRMSLLLLSFIRENPSWIEWLQESPLDGGEEYAPD